MFDQSKDILIASSSLDAGSWLPVADILDRRGHNVLAYEADRVASADVPFSMSITRDSELTIYYDGQEIQPANIAAAWYRRPTMFSREQSDKAKQFTLDTERRKALYQLWSSIADRAWLSAPTHLAHAEHKLTQLILARQVGLEIPATIITNNWKPIVDDLPSDIIFKPSYGMVYDLEGSKLAYTIPFRNNLKELPMEDNPFPGFWQPYLQKRREWRITLVGSESFDAAIYTNEEAKDDWRRHQLHGGVSFKSESFPDEPKEKCFKFLGQLGLGFGAFDFVEDYDGKITFLECNANGQFGWLEDELGFPISEAIATELISIANS